MLLDDPSPKRAIFLDRDGTLCEAMPEGEYPTRPEHIKVFTVAPKFVAVVKAMGYQPVIVTNQSMIGRGLGTLGQLAAVSDEFFRQLGMEIPLVMCTHRPDDGCDCRKPKPGLFIEAAKTMNLDLERSIMVGDKDSDVKAGRAAGCALNYRLTLPGDCGGPGSLSWVLLDLVDLNRAGLLP